MRQSYHLWIAVNQSDQKSNCRSDRQPYEWEREIQQQKLSFNQRFIYRQQGETYPDNNFAVASLNLTGQYQFDDVVYINTLIIDGFIHYYPSLENMDEDWIFRSNLTFTVPLFDFLSVKLAYNLINDSNPNPSVGNNKTSTKLLFGFDF